MCIARLGQKAVSKKRRRQLDLIGEIVLGLTGTVMFGLCAFVILATGLASSVRTPIIGWLETAIGREATMIVFAIGSLLLALGCLLLAIRAVRLLRNKAYLEAREPTWEDFM